MNTPIRNHSNRLDTSPAHFVELSGTAGAEGATKQVAPTASNVLVITYQQPFTEIGRRYSFDDNGGGYQGL